MGLFFSDYKPRITKEEFKKVRNNLYGHDFSHKEIDRIAEIFRGDLLETPESQKGIDAGEVLAGITWLRENIGRHPFSPAKIDIIEQIFNKYLKPL